MTLIFFDIYTSFLYTSEEIYIYGGDMFNLSQFGVKSIRISKGEKLEEKIKDLEREKIIVVIYIFETKDQRDNLYEMFKSSQKMIS
jgi:hypothetical protein